MKYRIISNLDFLYKGVAALSRVLCISFAVILFETANTFAQPNIVKAEYFFDTEPGFGNGIDIPVTQASQVTDVVFSADITALTKGVHQLFVRVCDANGIWSISNRTFFYKSISDDLVNITQAEYFFDTDPGFGNGFDIPITQASQVNDIVFNADITVLTNGVHQLFVRVRDANGIWSISNRIFFYKSASDNEPDLTRAEYFFDTDPGFGQAMPIVITSGPQILDKNFYAGIDSLSAGTHHLFLRVQDANGTWSITNTVSINTNSFRVCPGGGGVLASPISGSSYQWQVNTGSGFVDISNNANYNDVTTANLQLINIPSSFTGYEYRCVVNGVNSSSIILKITTSWTGSAGTAWENPANWSCGILPDANTDVIVNSGAIIIVNSNVTCRSIDAKPGTSLTVVGAFILTLTGK